MATTVTTNWIYPPNWDSNPPEATNSGWKRVEFNRTMIVSGTTFLNETDAIVLDISQLRCNNGSVPTRTVVEYISWKAYGLTTILLEWDRAGHHVIADLSGADQGEFDFCKGGGGGMVDPSGTPDRTGNILITTAGGAALDTYNLHMRVRLKDR